MICLIGGTGRSGTTILSKIFANHPKICNVPEWRFLIDPDGIIDFYTSGDAWSPYHYDLRVKRLFALLKNVSHQQYNSKFLFILEKLGLISHIPFSLLPSYPFSEASKFCPNFDSFCNELKNELVRFKFKGSWEGMPQFTRREMFFTLNKSKENLGGSLSNFLRKIIDDVKAHQNAEYYLEKNTWNILWFDKILELLPDAKMVHIFRDPRDVVSSFSKQKWMPTDIIQSSIIYNELIQNWENVKKKVPSESFMEISLESLVEKPEIILRNICKFWHLPWSDSLLDIKLTKANKGRWETEITQKDIKDVEIILGKYLRDWGYE